MVDDRASSSASERAALQAVRAITKLGGAVTLIYSSAKQSMSEEDRQKTDELIVDAFSAIDKALKAFEERGELERID